MAVILETPRLILREWTPEDVGALFAMCSDPQVMRHIGDGRAWSDERRAHLWLERVTASYRDYGYGPFAVVEKATGEIAGSCGFSYLLSLGEIDLGYVFARPYWGRGYATEAARACLHYGFEQLGITEVTANTDDVNYASRRVLEKIGFEFRGMKRYEGDGVDSAFYVARRPSGAE